jgi:preprotein translocase subunit SecB
MTDQNTNQQLDVQIKIESIAATSFNIYEENSKHFAEKTTTFELKVNVQLDQANPFIKILILTRVFNNEKKEILLCDLSTEGVFSVVNLEDLIKEKKSIPTELLEVFTSILISTTRGILLEKCTATFMENSLMPVINPRAFFKR